MVGVILVVGLLITPAATAYLLTDRLEKMMVLAALFGFTSILGGLYLSVWLNSAGGGAIMLFATLQFLAVLVFAPRYGLLADWQRRRNMVPQQVIEDIIASMFKSAKPVAEGDIAKYVETKPKVMKNAMKYLTDEGFAAGTDTYELTDKGRTEAMRLKKAHRVWETYLSYMGVPDSELHEKAHILEHYNDFDSIDYIYEKMGYPETDPHGAKIPPVYSDGSFCLTAVYGFSDKDVEIVSVETEKELAVGDVVRIIHTDDGWSAKKGGKTLELTDAEVESMTVRFLS
jgi:manganese/iron transport system permease protein/iron/zinc/copper transport system permease protein